ncbi:MAG: hypothetical protein WC091_22725 [Sulfuricellaceae bacterium]
MNNFFKSNRIAIAICLVYSLLATGGAAFFIKKSAREHHAASLIAAEKLLAAGASLEQANAEVAKSKEALEKEKALNENLKKMIAENDTELEQLRNTVKTMTASGAKASKSHLAKAPASVAPPVSATPPDCRPSEPKFSKSKIRALQNLQFDIRKRDKELKEKQRKLDEAAESMAREKRKLILQNSEYRWPH